MEFVSKSCLIPVPIMWFSRCLGMEVNRNKWVKVLLAQVCLILCDPMDYSQPGSSVGFSRQIRAAWLIKFRREIYTSIGTQIDFDWPSNLVKHNHMSTNAYLHKWSDLMRTKLYEKNWFKFSWPSISTGFTSADWTNCWFKIIEQKFPKSKTRTCYMPVAICIAFTLHRLL